MHLSVRLLMRVNPLQFKSNYLLLSNYYNILFTFKICFFSKKRIVIQMPLFINKWNTVANGNKMLEKCFICSQRTELEPGFFEGTVI
jgi:hypothetical protein